MKKRQLLVSLLSVFFLFNACQREFSSEAGGALSEGSLLSDITGDCLPKQVVGTYEEGVALDPTANYIQVDVNVAVGGSYTISSDTINGIYFKGTGVFTTTGLNTVILKGSGTPFAAGVQNFVITYGLTQCVVAVTTLPPGAGGPAEFTLVNSPNACSVVSLEGTYLAGTPVNSSNFVVINVNVTTIGTYSVTTTASNGLTFSGTGTLGGMGNQTIQLAAAGTPVAVGSTNIPITAGSSSCSFSVPVVGPAAYTVLCGTAQVNGQYTQGVALDGTNDVEIDVDVATEGAYSITTTINGMTFTDAGDFTLQGVQTITLTATGVPTAAGTFDANVTAGSTACTFPVTVDPPGAGVSGTWSFTVGTTNYSGSISDVIFDNTSLAPYTIVGFGGESTANPDEFMEIDLADFSSVFQNGETYNAAPGQPANANLGAFYYDNSTTTLYQADASVNTNTVVVTLTSHNTTTKTMTGTFTGVVIDDNGVLKTVTNGQFSFTYP